MLLKVLCLKHVRYFVLNAIVVERVKEERATESAEKRRQYLDKKQKKKKQKIERRQRECKNKKGRAPEKMTLSDDTELDEVTHLSSVLGLFM